MKIFITIFNISEQIGVDEKVINLWVEKATKNNSSIMEKVSTLAEIKSIKFDFEEYLDILKAGGLRILARQMINYYDFLSSNIKLRSIPPDFVEEMVFASKRVKWINFLS